MRLLMRLLACIQLQRHPNYSRAFTSDPLTWREQQDQAQHMREEPLATFYTTPCMGSKNQNSCIDSGRRGCWSTGEDRRLYSNVHPMKDDGMLCVYSLSREDEATRLYR
ncbi:hypothetical protein DFS33DRAFT_1308068, partial [Desarmillaria ectypa]